MEKMKYKKRFGQNFLYDQNILQKIYNSVSATENDLIIEIGPGSGNLTKWLIKYNCNVVAYEIDESLKPKLDLIEAPKLDINYADFLESDVQKDLSDYNYDNLYVVANIPYYITTPIIEKIIDENLKANKIILMVQKEVAQRLSSKPGTKDYGYITVLFNYYYNIKTLFDVNKKSFYPIPKVDSAIIELAPKSNKVKDIVLFTKLLKNAFQFKRKNLRNNLKCFDETIISKVLEENGYSLNDRAEDLPLDIFIKIADCL